MQSSPTRTATVFLVGAGPGDPGLLTLRGAACLAAADVVLYDYLVNPWVLEHARSSAELVCLGRHGAGPRLSQDEINARMVAEARAGRTVVRLKSGDPMVFAHAAEEFAALSAAGVPWEIVPGVTTALAVGAYAGIPLTQRECASAVALVTGHEDAQKQQPSLDYEALARFPGTLVFYMGVTTVGTWSAGLLAAGMSPETPVAIVRRCSWPNQQTFTCRLADVATQVSAHRLRPPAVVVVGEAVRGAHAFDLRASRPLWGTCVLVTRAAEQAEGLAIRLRQQGAEVRQQPAIAVHPPADRATLDAVLQRLGEFAWIVFTSANAVRQTFARLAELGRDARALGPVRLAAVGPGTSAALSELRLRADLEAEEFNAKVLAAHLAPLVRGQRVLWLRGNRGREVLAETLVAADARLEQVVAYDTSDVPAALPEVAQALAAGQIDWVTVTSPSIARSLVRLFGENLRRAKLASISPLTTASLMELGFTPSAEASEATMPGMVDAMVVVERACAADEA